MSLSVPASEILERRILAPNETPEEMYRRVARHVSVAELYNDQSRRSHRDVERNFLEYLQSGYFVPNSPTLANSGRRLGQLAACFVLPVEDSIDGIFSAIRSAALIHQSGGGTGFSFSRLRPRGSLVASSGNCASGPVSFMRVFNAATDSIKQGGMRRGANMGVLRIDHPDIREFIACKREGGLSNFNLSIAITDEYMKCLEDDHLFSLSFKGETLGTVKPYLLWDEIVESAWATGDPGLFFIDRVNRCNPTPWLGEIEAPNPCISGDTLMLTREGLRPIGEIGKAEFWTPQGWRRGKAWRKGTKSVVKVVLSSGQRITCTPDHKILAKWKNGEEWTQAADLITLDVEPFLGKGDWKEHPNSYTRDDLLRLGFLQGDGTFREDSDTAIASLGKYDDDVQPLFSSLRETWRDGSLHPSLG